MYKGKVEWLYYRQAVHVTVWLLKPNIQSEHLICKQISTML